MTEQSIDLDQTWTTAILNLIRGVGIGIANVIPGVSGGTIAAISGVYDTLVYCLGNVFRGGWRRTLAYLTPIAVGALAGSLAFAGVVDAALDAYPEQTLFFFIGLIAGSVPYLVKRAGDSRFRLRYVVPFIVALGLVVMMGLAERPPAGEPIAELDAASALVVVAAGGVGSIAMLVPGLSGSFLLLLFGFYATMTNAARTLNIPVLVLFSFGMLVGLVIASKAISWLLRNFHAASYYAIVGLVLGSLVGVWPGWGGGPGSLASVLCGVLGLVLSLGLGSDFKERFRARREHRVERETGLHG